ncbi:hypothetical protein MKX03_011799 [Papaver bracteatum]|nr:hypothetical protein MKX03_011799 [Papaver bracteatum]
MTRSLKEAKTGKLNIQSYGLQWTALISKLAVNAYTQLMAKGTLKPSRVSNLLLSRMGEDCHWRLCSNSPVDEGADKGFGLQFYLASQSQ